MNRRDYLIRMGIGAGAMVGATTLDAFGFDSGLSTGSAEARKNPLKGKQPVNLSMVPLPWLQRTAVLPPLNADPKIVRLIFYGLMGISYRIDHGKIVCDVGFHRNGDHNHHHRLSIYGYSTARCTPVIQQAATDDQPITRLSIATDLPVKPPYDQANFYQVGDPRTRQDLSDPYDFRWIIDFESDYLYGTSIPQGAQGLGHHSGVYKPVLTIPFGVFYTLRRTNSTFDAKNPADKFDVMPLANVADVIACSIFVEPNNAVNLTINGGKVPYTVQAPGEIYFINHCYKNENSNLVDCDHDAASTNKKEISDFYLQYKAFSIPTGRHEYELRLRDGGISSPIPGLSCADRLPDRILHPAAMSLADKKMTDEAPCAASGYGGGGGLPANP